MKKSKWTKKEKVRQFNRGYKTDFRNLANIRHLTRIITYLSEVECDYRGGIQRKTGLDSVKLKSALKFLVYYKIIFIMKRDKLGKRTNVKFYALNQFFKK